MFKFHQNVPFERLRHNDLEAYVREGFGGQPIEQWPVYNFFSQFLKGDEVGAQANFENWYQEQWDKYRRVAKEKGGMLHGSLHSLIERRGDEKTAIAERVGQRLAMLRGIQERGYEQDRAERIEGVKKDGLVYLQGGHHRAAALRALGYQELPGVLVFTSRLVYNLFKVLRRIKNG